MEDFKNTTQKTTKSAYILKTNKKSRGRVRAVEKNTIATSQTNCRTLLKDNHWLETDLVSQLHLAY